MEQLTFSETMARIEFLIKTGNGEPGRLYHILNFLQNGKSLYDSDRIYLENKLESEFSTEEEYEEPLPENPVLPEIQDLINSGMGDPGRLQHIYDMLTQNKSLYHSDQVYLDSKLSSTVLNKSYFKIQSTNSTQTIEEPQQQTIEEPQQQTIEEPQQQTIEEPQQQTIEEPQQQTKELSNDDLHKTLSRGSMPKGWTPPNNSNEFDEISSNIKNEEKKLIQQQKISNEINEHRSKLKKLITHRKEYEQKVSQEKSSLESQIKDERLKIETQTNLSREIITQKEELANVQRERVKVVKTIDVERKKTSRDLEQQKKQLVQAQLEQEEIEKQIQREKSLLSAIAEEQKLRLLEQAKIAHQIKLKQKDLEHTKDDYEVIVSQVNEEREKYVKAEKLKKLIKTQEDDLIKIKNERLALSNTISKEKEIISKKVKEEKERIKAQTKLSKQLKKEEKSFELLKIKHDKKEMQIKIKNQKLKERQQKLKTQIVKKDEKIKSLGRIPKTITKKNLKPLKQQTSAKKTKNNLS